jgi:hypothetical protein
VLSHHEWNVRAFSVRGLIQLKLENYAGALDDLKTVISLTPQKNIENIVEWAQCGLLSGQLARFSDALRWGQKRGFDLFALHARWLLHKSQSVEADRSLSRALSPLPEDVRRVRIDLNLTLGNYKKAMADVDLLSDRSFPWRFLLLPEVPTVLTGLDLGNPFLPAVIAGIHLWMSGRPHQIPHDLDVPIADQHEWACPTGRHRPRPVSIQATRYSRAVDPDGILPSLMRDASYFGRLIDVSLRDKRMQVCLGFAVIELVQLFTPFLHGSAALIPSFATMMSVPMNWIRFGNPNAPIFAAEYPNRASHSFFFERNGLPGRDAALAPIAFEILKEGLAGLGLTHLETAKTPQELLRKHPVRAAVPIPGSPGKVFLQQSKFGRPDFGVVLKNPGKFHSFARSWTRMFLAARTG